MISKFYWPLEIELQSDFPFLIYEMFKTLESRDCYNSRSSYSKSKTRVFQIENNKRVTFSVKGFCPKIESEKCSKRCSINFRFSNKFLKFQFQFLPAPLSVGQTSKLSPLPFNETLSLNRIKWILIWASRVLSLKISWRMLFTKES